LKNIFVFFGSSLVFFSDFAPATRSYCVSAIKINAIYFVLLSFFGNFAVKEGGTRLH